MRSRRCNESDDDDETGFTVEQFKGSTARSKAEAKAEELNSAKGAETG